MIVSRTRVLLVLLAVLAAAAVASILYRRAPPPELAEALPAGDWHLDLGGMEGAAAPAEDRARLLSLPYLAGKTEAGARSGVIFHDRQRAFAGVNLYVSGHGPEAILMDMEGRPLHRWRLPFERAFPDKAPTVETGFWRRAHLYPGGDLLALFQGGGLIRVDSASRLLWAVDAGFYNDLFVADDGRILSITKEAREIPGREGEAILEDSILVLSGEGEILDSISLPAAFRDSSLAGILEPMKSAGDVFHTNTVELLDGRGAPGSEILQAGFLLTSLREVDVVAVLDPETRRVVWARRGPWRRQHHPTLLDGGRLLLFDNRGRGGRSQVLEFEPDGEIHRIFPPEGVRFYSEEAGVADRLPNGNTLITESDRGRALEITPGGEIVWEFSSPHRAGPRGELVATLFEVVRLDASYAGPLVAASR